MHLAVTEADKPAAGRHLRGDRATGDRPLRTTRKACKFDWSPNGCSVPREIKNADSWKLIFMSPCSRHDFG
ncbi:hypothetical protein [Nonomuraea sp. SYSU D8015]|uniref:hypothetical protein n=1 Tax=Nonomuraea sp. SYSU D8015 TaxID=2593644 RepID=UPI001660903A|nr:hypothetical protein [Nonomuraea sp. SYSU D8015]